MLSTTYRDTHKYTIGAQRHIHTHSQAFSSLLDTHMNTHSTVTQTNLTAREVQAYVSHNTLWHSHTGVLTNPTDSHIQVHTGTRALSLRLSHRQLTLDNPHTEAHTGSRLPQSWTHIQVRRLSGP